MPIIRIVRVVDEPEALLEPAALVSQCLDIIAAQEGNAVLNVAAALELRGIAAQGVKLLAGLRSGFLALESVAIGLDLRPQHRAGAAESLVAGVAQRAGAGRKCGVGGRRRGFLLHCVIHGANPNESLLPQSSKRSLRGSLSLPERLQFALKPASLAPRFVCEGACDRPKARNSEAPKEHVDHAGSFSFVFTTRRENQRSPVPAVNRPSSAPRSDRTSAHGLYTRRRRPCTRGHRRSSRWRCSGRISWGDPRLSFQRLLDEAADEIEQLRAMSPFNAGGG